MATSKQKNKVCKTPIFVLGVLAMFIFSYIAPVVSISILEQRIIELNIFNWDSDLRSFWLLINFFATFAIYAICREKAKIIKYNKKSKKMKHLSENEHYLEMALMSLPIKYKVKFIEEMAKK